MKKFMKVIVTVSAVLCVVGIGLTTAGVVMGAGSDGVWQQIRHRVRHPLEWDDDNFDFWGDYDDDYDDDDYDDDYDYDDDWETGDIEKTTVALSDENTVRADAGRHSGEGEVYSFRQMDDLEIDLCFDELILEENEDDTVTVEVINDLYGDVSVREEGSSLEIVSTRRQKESKRTVKVSYPKGTTFRDAEISVDSGILDLRSDFAANSLDISVGAGEFKNSGSITAIETDLEVGAGTMDLTGLDAREISGECGMGTMDLKISGQKSDYSYTLECGIGSIQIDGDEYSGLAQEKQIDNPGAKKYIDLECGIGTINVEFE